MTFKRSAFYFLTYNNYVSNFETLTGFSSFSCFKRLSIANYLLGSAA